MAKPGSKEAAAIARARAATGSSADGGTQGLTVPEFDADARAQLRADATVTIGGRQFKRVKKTLAVSRDLRALLREQETSIARGAMVAARIGELEAEQMEKAADGKDEDVNELEGKIAELIEGVDAAREAGELVSFKIIRLLLDEQAGTGDDADEVLNDDEVLEHLIGELDVEDAVTIAQLLSTGRDPNREATQETAVTGS